MKLVDRYVLWTFLKNYLIAFMVLVGMYVVLDMVFNFDDLVDVRGTTAAAQDGGIFTTIGDIGDYYFYQIFLFFVYLSGIIPVVAAAFTLMRLSRFNELTALLAAGVPLLRVAMPIILAGVVLNGLLIADQELIIPLMIPKLTRSHDEMHRTDVKSFPIPSMQDDHHALLRVTKYTPSSEGRPATMQMVDITERREVERMVDDAQGKPRKRRVMEPVAHISADSATWNESTQSWDLEHGLRGTGLAPWHEDAPTTRAQTPHSPEPDVDDLVTKIEKIAAYKSNVTPEEIALYRSGDWVDLLPTNKLDELIARPGSYGQTHLQVVKHMRFTQPIMNVILLLLAIPCVLTREPGKLKAAATKCLALTGIGMGAVFLSHQFAGKSPNPNWTQTWPVIIAWLPLLIFGQVAVILLNRVKT